MHLLWDSGYFSTIFWTPYPLLLSRRLSKFFFKNLVLQKHPLVGAKQLYWNQTSAYVFSCKFAAYIQKTFFWEHLRGCFWFSNTQYEKVWMLRPMEFTYYFSIILYDNSPCGRFLLFIIHSLFLSRNKLRQLSDDPTDFISSTLIDGDCTIGQD